MSEARLVSRETLVRPGDVRRLSASVEFLFANSCLTVAARRTTLKRIERLSALARRKRTTSRARIVRRLAVPCTPSELAASFRKPVTVIRSFLWLLKDAGLVERTNKTVPIVRRSGRQREYLWQRTERADRLREEAKGARA